MGFHSGHSTVSFKGLSRVDVDSVFRCGVHRNSALLDPFASYGQVVVIDEDVFRGIKNSHLCGQPFYCHFRPMQGYT